MTTDRRKSPDYVNDNSKHRLQLLFNVLQIEPTHISLDITVSSPSIVWCGAWKVGEDIDVIDLQRRIEGIRIRSDILIIGVTNRAEDLLTIRSGSFNNL